MIFHSYVSLTEGIVIFPINHSAIVDLSHILSLLRVTGLLFRSSTRCPSALEACSVRVLRGVRKARADFFDEVGSNYPLANYII